jgi:hypothetical protein
VLRPRHRQEVHRRLHDRAWRAKATAEADPYIGVDERRSAKLSDWLTDQDVGAPSPWRVTGSVLEAELQRVGSTVRIVAGHAQH